MRTLKALLCLSALAGGLAVTQAQNVYSLNIVGYYNVPTPGGLTAMTASLKAGSNRADEVVPYSDGDNIQVWTGVSWQQFGMDSGATSGWVDGAGTEVPKASLPMLTPGKGFFYGKSTAITTVTFVGDVSMTNAVSLATGLNAVGSPIPYAGAVSTGPIALPAKDGDDVQTWNGSRWVLTTKDSGAAPTGWADAAGNSVPEPTMTVGQGFFFGNNSGAAATWTQILNP